MPCYPPRHVPRTLLCLGRDTSPWTAQHHKNFLNARRPSRPDGGRLAWTRETTAALHRPSLTGARRDAPLSWRRRDDGELVALRLAIGALPLYDAAYDPRGFLGEVVAGILTWHRRIGSLVTRRRKSRHRRIYGAARRPRRGGGRRRRRSGRRRQGPARPAGARVLCLLLFVTPAQWWTAWVEWAAGVKRNVCRCRELWSNVVVGDLLGPLIACSVQVR